MANAKDQVTIDLTNYKDKVGNRVAPGRYLVVVDDSEPDISSQGNKMINLWLRVVGGEFSDAVIVDRLVLTEKSLFRVVGFMQALGLPTPKKRLQINIALWRGKRLYIDVEDGEPYNGNIKSEVRGYDRVRGLAAAGDVSGLPDDARAADEDNADLNGLAGLTGDTDSNDLAAGVAQSDDLGEVPEEIDLDSLEL